MTGDEIEAQLLEWLRGREGAVPQTAIARWAIFNGVPEPAAMLAAWNLVDQGLAEFTEGWHLLIGAGNDERQKSKFGSRNHEGSHL